MSVSRSMSRSWCSLYGSEGKDVVGSDGDEVITEWRVLTRRHPIKSRRGCRAESRVLAQDISRDVASEENFCTDRESNSEWLAPHAGTTSITPQLLAIRPIHGWQIMVPPGIQLKRSFFARWWSRVSLSGVCQTGTCSAVVGGADYSVHGLDSCPSQPSLPSLLRGR